MEAGSATCSTPAVPDAEVTGGDDRVGDERFESEAVADGEQPFQCILHQVIDVFVPANLPDDNGPDHGGRVEDVLSGYWSLFRTEGAIDGGVRVVHGSLHTESRTFAVFVGSYARFPEQRNKTPSETHYERLADRSPRSLPRTPPFGVTPGRLTRMYKCESNEASRRRQQNRHQLCWSY